MMCLGSVLFAISLRRDATQHYWHDNVFNSSRCDFYKLFKSQLNPEKYLSIDMPFYYRKALARFRCSSHKLKIEVGRHTNIPRENRICTFCFENVGLIVIENEFHAFFVCGRFEHTRTALLFTWYTGRTSEFALLRLMKSENVEIIKNTAIFIAALFKEYESVL